MRSNRTPGGGRTNGLILFLGVLVLGCGIYCFKDWSQPRKITFVLPDGFRGLIKIVINEESGIAPRGEGGAIILAVPHTGLLTIPDPQIFANWHHIEAVYANGNTVPTFQGEDEVSGEGVKFYSLSSSVVNNKGLAFWFLVGTNAEKERFYAMPQDNENVFNAKHGRFSQSRQDDPVRSRNSPASGELENGTDQSAPSDQKPPPRVGEAGKRAEEQGK